MYLWRRLVSQKWWSDSEKELRAIASDRLAIIERADRKRLQLEVASRSRTELQNLTTQFGGRVEKLPGDWLRRSSRKTKPLKVGKRLVITNVGGTSASRIRARRAWSPPKGASHIFIPAGRAFGTGEHATTAMSLRLLEKLTRSWKPGWSMVDLGTGSGILALAAKCFGATRVIGIDSDPIAISTAKENARLNKISSVQFCVGDVRRWKSPRNVDIVTANLFSELLIEILPKLKAARWLILSGILRGQERDVTRAFKRHKIDILQLRRRGKWVAILAAVR
ncbi:MAG TPA: 50S ribosomal protein L11 methyltransferase [Chthoniobacterales bacterium]|nr:50S ribosomal protein L11 methyltransferase [Chthoniobacterales bacterium]